MIKKISLIVLSLLITSGYSYSQNDGAANTGLAFLKTGVGAREISMGEAVSSITEDASSMYYNPSRMLFGGNNVSFMHNASVQGYSTDFVGAKITWNRFAMGISIHTASINDIEIRTTPGAMIDKFSARDLSIGLSLAL